MKRPSALTPTSLRPISISASPNREEETSKKRWPSIKRPSESIPITSSPYQFRNPILQKGMFDQALGEYQKTIEIKPDYAKDIIISEAFIWKRRIVKRRSPPSKKLWKSIQRYAEAHYALAAIYYEKKEFKLPLNISTRLGNWGWWSIPNYWSDSRLSLNPS